MGDAATDNRLPYSTAHNMYKAVAKIVQKKVEMINKTNRAANPLCPLFTQMPMRGGKGERTRGAPTPILPYLTSLLLTPLPISLVAGAIDRTTLVCAIPSPPPAPLPPYSVKLTDSAVHLRWNNLDFSGDAPIEYNLQARGQAKLNGVWVSVGTYSKIKDCWFNVVHLVAGVALQFRVRAANHGGWGDWSESSEFYKVRS